MTTAAKTGVAMADDGPDLLRGLAWHESCQARMTPVPKTHRGYQCRGACGRWMDGALLEQLVWKQVLRQHPKAVLIEDDDRALWLLRMLDRVVVGTEVAPTITLQWKPGK